MSNVIIIAEAGVNHNGDINLAKKLIDVAAEAGVDYVKFQTWITENVLAVGAPKAEYQEVYDDSKDQFTMAKNLELSFDQFKQLADYCILKNVNFLSTPEEVDGLNFLADELNLPIIKIGSGELDNLIFLRQVGRKKRDVILSTGMGTLQETKRAFDTLIESGAKSVKILHCTTNYPVAFENINLKAMQTLASTFNVDVGYSDHSPGVEASVAAVAMGAKIIEKHFTLDKTMKGPDHSASLDPTELKVMVSQIRNVEKAISGTGNKEPQASEIEIMKVIRKGPYLSKSLKKGETLTENHLHFKRPVRGIAADQADQIIGKNSLRDLPAGHCLDFSDFF